MSAATFQLRKLRKLLYEKMETNPTINDGLTRDFIGYQNQVGEFINWRNNVRQTESQVKHF